MEILNLSAEPIGKLHGWTPRDLEAERMVFLPDACPGKSPLPTGTAVLTRQINWRKFAISDCGCGMRLLRSSVPVAEFARVHWDAVAGRLRSNKGKLGDLGGGNHFLDALAPYGDGPVHFLVHTGSRDESGLVDQFLENPVRFDAEFARVVEWACENRAQIQKELEAIFGKTELVLDKPHNTYDRQVDGSVIIRKGAVKLIPGDLAVIPSHLSGDVVVVKGTSRMKGILNSMSHGTGRTMSRGDCKPLAEAFDFEALRMRIVIPESIDNASLRTEGPYAYRSLDDCLALIEGYVEELERFAVIGYMGHL